MAEPPDTTTAVRSLDDLPDHILVQILSSFPTTADAIETSFLSRKWRNLWLSTPSLSFSCHRFFIPNSYPCPESLRSFTDFIEQTLILRPQNAPLLSFKVQFDFPHREFKFSSHVASWIRFAVSKNAQTLDFDLYDYNGNADNYTIDVEYGVQFEFPFYLLRNSRVSVLKLGGCDLSLPMSENTRFLSLRSLSLHQVVMTDQMLVDLMAACVNVEALELNTVKGCKHFKIRSSKLRELALSSLNVIGSSIEIITPNLYALNMDFVHLDDYALTDVSSLVEAKVGVIHFQCFVKVMRFLGHVQRLTSASNMWAQLLESKDVNSESFILQNLKYAMLLTEYKKSDMMGIAQLLVLSPNLQTLILANCPVLCQKTYDDSISEDFIRQLSFRMPNLRHIKMRSFMGMECEKNLLIVLLKTAVILERLVIIPAKVEEETPRAPIILDPQFNGLQDFEYFVRRYPRQKTWEERWEEKLNLLGGVV